MKQPIFLGHVRSHYVPKNKLQKAISDYIDTLDGVAFPADKLPEVKKKISAKIDALNKEHKRSTPVKIEFNSYRESSWKNTGIGKVTCHLHGIQSISFVFIKGILKQDLEDDE